MILSALLALALQAGSWPEVVYRCRVDIGPFEDVRTARVYLEQDEKEDRIGHVLTIEAGDLGATWTLSGSSVDTMRDFDLEITLPEDSASPEQITLAVDGRPIWSGQYTRLTTATGRTKVAVQTLRPYTIPTIFGADRLQTTVFDADGATILDRTIPLPDWSRIERRLPRGVRAVDRVARGRRCLPARQR